MILRAAIVSLLLSPAVAALAQQNDGQEEAVAAIEAAGGRVMKIAANTDDQEVQFYLSDKDVTDDTLKYVPKIANVVWLNLRGTKITDAGLESLKSLDRLTRLHLEKTGISDAGLPYLAGLVNLQYLNLYGTKVSDAGLEHLKGLKKLQKLYLWQTQVTEEGVKKLKEALPDTEIVLGTEVTAPPEKKEG